MGYATAMMAYEEVKIGLINKAFSQELPPGMGASFWAGGQIARHIMKGWRFGPQSNYGGGINAKYNLNPLLEKHVWGGVGFATASEVALPVEALVADIMDHESYQRFWEKNYGEFSLNRVSHNVLLGSAMGIHCLLYTSPSPRD